MIRIARIGRCLLLSGFVFSACTSNPFGDAGIQPPKRVIRGQVRLSDGAPPDDVYVWLEQVNMGTRTDSLGRFELTLSPQPGRFRPSGILGLYFYVANYRLARSTVLLREGEFLYGHGDLDGDGNLREVKHIPKILDVRTSVDPDSVDTTFEGQLHIFITLQAVSGVVKVVFPRMSLLLRSIGSGKDTVRVVDIASGSRVEEQITMIPKTRRLDMDLKPGDLPPGWYRFIPYIFVEQDSIPSGLIASLGPSVQQPGPDYLKLPFKREGGDFRVTAPDE